MRIDVKRLTELIDESQDRQVDALRDSKASLPDLRDIASDRRHAGTTVSTDEIDLLERSRAQVLKRLGLTGGIASAGALGVAMTALVGKAAAADSSIDIQMLQTASSLEILAVATYSAALTLPFISGGNPVIVKFAQTTMQQHSEHNAAFQAQCKALGGVIQMNPSPKYGPVVEAAKPKLKTPADVVMLAATLETVATETYLMDLTLFKDRTSKALMASVMGVECQHLATLRAVGALLAGAPDLIKIPIGADAAKLPAAAGSVAFPSAFEPVTMASPPAEGAVK